MQKLARQPALHKPMYRRGNRLQKPNEKCFKPASGASMAMQAVKFRPNLHTHTQGFKGLHYQKTAHYWLLEPASRLVAPKRMPRFAQSGRPMPVQLASIRVQMPRPPIWTLHPYAPLPMLAGHTITSVILRPPS